MTQYIRMKSDVINGDRFRNMSQQITSILTKNMDEAGQISELEAHKFIDMAGTGNAWSGDFTDRGGGKRSGPSAGRIDTGFMQRDYQYRTTKGKNVGLDVGWINNYEDYYGAQDAGFSAPGYRTNPLPVQGMGLTRHMRDFTEKEMDKAMDRSIRTILNGL